MIKREAVAWVRMNDAEIEALDALQRIEQRSRSSMIRECIRREAERQDVWPRLQDGEIVS